MGKKNRPTLWTCGQAKGSLNVSLQYLYSLTLCVGWVVLQTSEKQVCKKTCFNKPSERVSSKTETKANSKDVWSIYDKQIYKPQWFQMLIIWAETEGLLSLFMSADSACDQKINAR